MGSLRIVGSSGKLVLIIGWIGGCLLSLDGGFFSFLGGFVVGVGGGTY